MWYIMETVGHWSFEDSRNPSVNKNYPHLDLRRESYKWYAHLDTLASGYLSKFEVPPTVVIANVGRWGQKLTVDEAYRIVFDMLSVAKIFIWKTTTYSAIEDTEKYNKKFDFTKRLKELDAEVVSDEI